MREFFTSESVTEGHPDKIADSISDAVLDMVLTRDPRGRVAIETLTTNGLVVIAGELTTKTYIDIPAIAREVIKDAGYTKSSYGFHYTNTGVLTAIQGQSPDIARGVIHAKKEAPARLGAGDQGIMFGYATDETKELMPAPIVIAHKLVKRLVETRKKRIIPYLRPDGKAQVTLEYENGQIRRVANVIVSTQHDPEVKLSQLRRDIKKYVIETVVPRALLGTKTKYFINPTGRFVLGGPQADTGLTGRKIIVDTYGGIGSHGGGAFSGKDPTKVDRSGSYAARYVAKNVVAAKLANKVEVRVSYAIGVSRPMSLAINTHGTGKFSDEKILSAVQKVFDLRPGMIIKNLKLRRPLYRQVATYGHFGRNDLRLPWEKTDKVKDLKKLLS